MADNRKVGFDEPLVEDVTKEHLNNSIRTLTENINRILSQVRDLDGKAAKFDDNGNLVFDGDIECNDGLFSSNSIYLGNVKISAPEDTDDTYVMQYDLSTKEIRFASKSAILTLHSNTHSSGGEDEIDHDDLANNHQNVKTSASPTFAGLTIGDGTNQTVFESDGTQRLEGTATVYDDLQVSISNIKAPTSNAPTDRLYNFGIGGGVTFPVLGFAVGDYIYFDVQTTHSTKLLSAIDDHLHYILPNTTNIGDNFKFQLDVIVAGVNETWAVPTGSPFTSEGTVATNDNIKHRIFGVAEIPGDLNTTISTVYKCKLTRISATFPALEYGSEVYVFFTDVHTERDSLGSDQEYVK